MGKGRPRAVEKVVLGPNASVSTTGSLNIPTGPVYYPTQDEFRDPLEFLEKIRPEAEQFGICKIVPPQGWNPPFALDLDSFTFPTKTQAIHQLQARAASCDPKTFGLEYIRFLEEHCGRKPKKRVVFEGVELDLCRLFNAVKRFGGYAKVVKNKKWGEIFRFVRPRGKITECAKHVLSQLYLEHLCDYEEHHNKLNKVKEKSRKRGGAQGGRKGVGEVEVSSFKRRRKNIEGDKIEKCKQEDEEVRDQICEQCRSGLHGEVMLLCDRCNKGWHIYCLSPPLKRVPPGNWYCMECLNSEKDTFGFVPGKQFSLETFRRVADRAKKKWFGSTSTSRIQLEKKFWEIVEGSVGEVEVIYGSDLDTSVYGSGFPRENDQRPSSVGAEEWEEYCANPWNLNNLPKLPGSVLQAVHHGIAGVMVPWLYMGMLFSSFCWHFEDHCFYSMNYLHWGEPKCWYSVPGSEADAFEKVMRNSLPDLFDAQPDLLFQLVTMLNPTVLQENGVPVYSVLQEPGNFIITFPRSYHGGFNLGLNCAEAVNFAPADWLPHGGFGAELYQLYHKPAVLSHEELLCVVAKSEFDSRASKYLRPELLRIYNKEKAWREKLWKNGILSSAPLSPKKHPEHIGTEEDPTCIICQQFLYLSAVVCRCRPSVFVCLEHWEHLCECKASKHCLLYRHTLAELNDLVLLTEKHGPEDQSKNSRRQLTCPNETTLSRKVRGGYVLHAQLAEEWLLKSCKILTNPYSRDSYANAIKEAKQFLWAGSEMDPVRDMTKKLVEGKNWAEAVRDCLSKVESWSHHQNPDAERVHMEHVNKLMALDPVPCNEPCYSKLKEYQEEANSLIREIEQALDAQSKFSIVELEVLSSKALVLPIYTEESNKLLRRLSSAKHLVESVRQCLEGKSPAVEADILYKLQTEIVDLQIELPECEMLANLIQQVDLCRSRCIEIFEGPICLKKLEMLIHEYDGFTVNIPELKLLREYHRDAVSWVSHVNQVLVDISCREDQENVVEELTSILRDGKLLKVQVDELPQIETELKKASCRVKALKALRSKMDMTFIEQLIAEATVLQIEKEKLFTDISEVFAVALHWEERAKHLLALEGTLSEFEDILRTSEDIGILLASLEDITDAVSMAKTWLSKCSPFLYPDSYASTSSSLLKLEHLKELISESKLLKISLQERNMLETVLGHCIVWEQKASSLLHDAVCLINEDALSEEISNTLIKKIECQLPLLKSTIEDGLSLKFEFQLISKLQDAHCTLQWCFKALSFSDVIPTLEEVDACLEVSNQLPATYASCTLYTLLIDGMNWLKNALEILPPCNGRLTKVNEAEEVLGLSQKIGVQFPLMIGVIQNAIEKHNLWLDEVDLFFNLRCTSRRWNSLLHLKELARTDAFNCSELDMVLAEVQKVEQWKQHCRDVARSSSVSDKSLLSGALLEIKNRLDRALYIYKKSKCSGAPDLCFYCTSNVENQKLVTCFSCGDSFHLQCVGSLSGDSSWSTTSCVCPYCDFLRSGKIFRTGVGVGILRAGQKFIPSNKLVELLKDAESHCLWIEERSILQQIVENALECNSCLMRIAEFALGCHDGDLSILGGKLVLPLKALDIASICDNEGKSKFELALARNSWKVTAQKLLENSEKPTIQQIQRHLKEGQAVSIPPEDYFRRQLTEVKNIGLQWAEMAKKVSADGGTLALDRVYALIAEGEDLPVSCEKELKLLKDRSMLYCICRRPYDQRAMIACDNCDEWYHFDCIKLSSAPKIYICPACIPDTEEDICSSVPLVQESRCTSGGNKVEEPQTPSPRRTELIRKLGNSMSTSTRKISKDVSNDTRSVGMGKLQWSNRKPYRRLARKRAVFQSLSPFFHIHSN